MLKKLNNDDIDLDDIDLDDMDSNIASFFNDDMGLVTIDVN